MKWPSWLSSRSEGHDEEANSKSWSDQLNRTDWSHYTDRRTVVPTLILTTAAVATYQLYTAFLKRIPQARLIPSSYWHRRSLFGQVISVGDGDGFRLYHTPGGRLAGWGWLWGRKIPEKRKGLTNETVSIRLAGIDAPELAHFGHPAQPLGEEAWKYLQSWIGDRRVRAYVLKLDQYDRAVATVYVWKWLWRRDVSLRLLKVGLATMYEGHQVPYHSQKHEERYRKAEAKAKARKKGIWSIGKAKFESPRQFKARMGQEDQGKSG